MTTGLRNSAENVAKRVAKLTSGVSSKLDKVKVIDKGTRMDIAGRVKKMREVVDNFDKFSSERLRGLEERDKRRLEREKNSPKSKQRGQSRAPKRAKASAPTRTRASEQRPSTPTSSNHPARMQTIRPRTEVPNPGPVAEHPPTQPPPPRANAQPPHLIMSRDLAPVPSQPSPGTASKIMSFLPA